VGSAGALNHEITRGEVNGTARFFAAVTFHAGGLENSLNVMREADSGRPISLADYLPGAGRVE